MCEIIDALDERHMISVSKVPDKPIVVVTIACSIADFLAVHKNVAHQQVQSYLNAADGPLHVIYNLHAVVDLGYSDILLWLGEYHTEYVAEGSPFDWRVRLVMVGDNLICALWAKKIRLTHGIEIPRYDTLKEAIHAVQQVVATAPSA